MKRKKIAKPNDVFVAVRILYISYFISVIGNLLFSIRDSFPSRDSLGFTTYVTIYLLSLSIFVAFFIFLIYKIDTGRNWARITYLVIFTFLFLFGIIGIFAIFLTYPFLSFFTLCVLIAQLIAVILLFQKSSSEWFRYKNE